jgi:hypothetical protein
MHTTHIHSGTVADLASLCAPTSEMKQAWILEEDAKKKDILRDKIEKRATERLYHRCETSKQKSSSLESFDRNMIRTLARAVLSMCCEIDYQEDVKNKISRYADKKIAYELCIKKFPRSKARAENFSNSIAGLEGSKRVSILALEETIRRVQNTQELRDCVKIPGGLVEFCENSQRIEDAVLTRDRLDKFEDLAESAIFRIAEIVARLGRKSGKEFSENLRSRVAQSMRVRVSRLSLGDYFVAKETNKSCPPHTLAAIARFADSDESNAGFQKHRARSEALLDILSQVQRENNAAMSVQRHMRCRLARVAVRLVREERKKRKIMQTYVKERKTRLLNAFETEQEEYRKQRIIEEISNITRFHWKELVDSTSGYPYYIHEKTEKSVWTRPTYKVSEYDAVTRINTLVRSFFVYLDLCTPPLLTIKQQT